MAPLTLHASCVAIAGQGLLILGASGSGKSALALNLIALGAGLVADDRTQISREGDALIAACPPAISGLIEARGIGILRSRPHSPCPIALIVNMDVIESDRLPPQRSMNLLDLSIPLLHKVDRPHFPAALHLYMTCGRDQP